MSSFSRSRLFSRCFFGIFGLGAILALDLRPSIAVALTANKVWFESYPGFIRVAFQYTLPEIKEFRGGYVDFTSKKKAEVFYWSLVRGADFEYGSPEGLSFQKEPAKPQPW